MQFSFVDVETTGFEPGTASMVELAILTTDESGTILDRYDTMLNPLLKMQATRIHGIKAAHVLAAPTFDLVAAEVAERLDGTVVVAYNAPFDSRFLGHAMTSIGGRIDGRWVCALDHAKSCTELSRYRLIDVAAALGLRPSGEAHSALVDAELCAAAFFALGDCQQQLRPAKVSVGTRYRVPPMPRSLAEAHGTARRPTARERSLSRTGTDVSAIVAALHEAFADEKVTLAEVKGLAAACEEAGLSAGDLLAAFNRFLDEEIASVLADGKVDSDERQRLRVISHHLGFPAPYIERRLVGEHATDTLGGALQPGLTVVFTNVDDDVEWRLGQIATTHGLSVRHGVSKTTDLVVFDGRPTTGKATKAIELGIPLMALAEFEQSLPGTGGRLREPHLARRAPGPAPRLVTGADLDDEVVQAPRDGRAPRPAGSFLRKLLRRS